MKDIEIFNTEYGAAALILKDIPYRGRAYIRIHSSLDPALLLEECVGFCRACGAETIYLAECPDAKDLVAQFPLTAEIVQMEAVTSLLASCDAELVPVTKETAGQWRGISNEHMASVPLSAYLSAADDDMLTESGGAYFVYKERTLIGIGKISGSTIEQVVSLQPGCGESIVRTLATKVTDSTVHLSVAKENTRAVRLYRRLNFVQTEILSRWYQVFPQV